MFSVVFFGDNFLEFVSHFLVIPILFCEKPLYGSNGDVGLKCDGFTIFSCEVGNESGELNAKIVSCILVWRTGFESSEQFRQIGSNICGVCRVHLGVLHASMSYERRIMMK